MKKALIIVDIQNDYFEGGKYELVNALDAAKHAQQVLDYFRTYHLPIFHIQHISLSESATFFLPHTSGAEIHQLCAPQSGEKVLVKHRPDSFIDTGLKEELEACGIEAVVICGMMTHMCIDTTVRAANQNGYPVELIEDACATRDLEWNGIVIPANQVQGAYMAALSGSFAKVYQAEEWFMATEKCND